MALTLNSKIAKIPILATTVLTGLMLNTFSLPAQAGTINYPRYNGRLIDGCPINMQCTNQGTSYVADKYCNLIGYRRASYWQTKWRGKLRRRHKLLKLEHRPSGNVWLGRKGKYYFKRIDCSF